MEKIYIITRPSPKCKFHFDFYSIKKLHGREATTIPKHSEIDYLEFLHDLSCSKKFSSTISISCTVFNISSQYKTDHVILGRESSDGLGFI
jgi:hypothetical protein